MDISHKFTACFVSSPVLSFVRAIAMEVVLDLEGERPRDDEIMAQHHAIRAQEAEKIPFVGDKVLVLSLLFLQFQTLACSVLGVF